jgi:micrococcal nuclease
MGRLRLSTVGAWAVGALLLLATAACSDTATLSPTGSSPESSLGVGGGSLASSTATASAEPTPTPRPAAQAPAQPVQAPVQAAGVSFINAPLSARHGQATTLVVKTSPNTGCSIRVVYKSGPSHAQGLVAKTSDGAGNVSWAWIVGSNTTAGQWPIYVTCGSASGQTYITVT